MMDQSKNIFCKNIFCDGDGFIKHPRIYMPLSIEKDNVCSYCSKKFEKIKNNSENCKK